MITALLVALLIAAPLVIGVLLELGVIPEPIQHPVEKRHAEFAHFDPMDDLEIEQEDCHADPCHCSHDALPSDAAFPADLQDDQE